ncbi:hypothetical protein, partial [Bacteroides finegoldii]|uniref:hypothetical protein n=1 Tax=Bacteroides finegoldii TaxID=338188 RepID=UPI0032EB4F46
LARKNKIIYFITKQTKIRFICRETTFKWNIILLSHEGNPKRFIINFLSYQRIRVLVKNKKRVRLTKMETKRQQVSVTSNATFID